uniref:Uncharacterized protein n=1 Tax=Setaria italica TaxID=4555 RepID=K3Y0I8_SETIT
MKTSSTQTRMTPNATYLQAAACTLGAARGGPLQEFEERLEEHSHADGDAEGEPLDRSGWAVAMLAGTEQAAELRCWQA